jgi:UDP-hydrolysing UDP-N-acetyl-D-glucosamine 2-epimerase
LRSIAFFTSTRAEYGLLRPLMAEVASRPGLSLQVIVSGTHLSEAHGATWREIVADGFPIDARVEMAVAGDDAEGVALSAAQVLSGVAGALVRLKSDVLVLLGDRYELLAAAQAAVLARVPIAHIHGGEATEGAIDESIRHAVTKLSHWHFAAAEPYAERIRQMGEAPARVWNVGAPAMDNIAAPWKPSSACRCARRPSWSPITRSRSRTTAAWRRCRRCSPRSTPAAGPSSSPAPTPTPARTRSARACRPSRTTARTGWFWSNRWALGAT